jgi:hypothetical protein
MGSSQTRATLLFRYLFDIHFGWLESRAERNPGDKMVWPYDLSQKGSLGLPDR